MRPEALRKLIEQARLPINGLRKYFKDLGTNSRNLARPSSLSFLLFATTPLRKVSRYGPGNR